MYKFSRIFIIVIMTFLMVGMAFCVGASAKAAEIESYKYVKEARLVLGKTEEEAASWLKENKYEPILAENPEARRNQELSGNGVLVLGIKRTADPKEAIDNLGIDVWSSKDVTTLKDPPADEWIALLSVSEEGASKPILADSIVLRYGAGEMPEGCTKMLHLTSFTALDPENTEDQGLYLFWDVEKEPAEALPASSFTEGSFMLAISAGLMIGIIGATCFLLPQKRKEEAKREAEKQKETENKWWY